MPSCHEFCASHFVFQSGRENEHVCPRNTDRLREGTTGGRAFVTRPAPNSNVTSNFFFLSLSLSFLSVIRVRSVSLSFYLLACLSACVSPSVFLLSINLSIFYISFYNVNRQTDVTNYQTTYYTLQMLILSFNSVWFINIYQTQNASQRFTVWDTRKTFRVYYAIGFPQRQINKSGRPREW